MQFPSKVSWIDERETWMEKWMDRFNPETLELERVPFTFQGHIIRVDDEFHMKRWRLEYEGDVKSSEED